MAASSGRPPFGDELGAARGVAFDDGLQAEFGDDVADLAEGDGVGVGAFEAADGSTFDGEGGSVRRAGTVRRRRAGRCRAAGRWMSGTRPARVFSQGSMARAAVPSRTAAMASSKVSQGRVVMPG